MLPETEEESQRSNHPQQGVLPMGPGGNLTVAGHQLVCKVCHEPNVASSCLTNLKATAQRIKMFLGNITSSLIKLQEYFQDLKYPALVKVDTMYGKRVKLQTHERKKRAEAIAQQALACKALGLRLRNI